MKSRMLSAFLARWLPPAALLIVAGFQLAQVAFAGQTRWRGGGFGMYSELHPNNAAVWWRAANGKEAVRLSGKDDPMGVRDVAARCTRVRSEQCLRSLLSDLPVPLASGALELWVPRFDVATGTLERRLAASIER